MREIVFFAVAAAASAAAAAASAWFLRKKTPISEDAQRQTDDLVEKIEQKTAYRAVIQRTIEDNKSGESEAPKVEQEFGKKQEEQPARQKVTEITNGHLGDLGAIHAVARSMEWKPKPSKNTIDSMNDSSKCFTSSYQAYNNQISYDVPFFRNVMDNNIHGQVLSSSSEVLSSHAAISTLPASAAVIPQQPVQQQQQQQTMEETEYRAKLAEVHTELEPLEIELIEHKGKLDLACAESKLLKEKECGKKQESLVPLEQPARQKVTEITNGRLGDLGAIDGFREFRIVRDNRAINSDAKPERPQLQAYGNQQAQITAPVKTSAKVLTKQKQSNATNPKRYTQGVKDLPVAGPPDVKNPGLDGSKKPSLPEGSHSMLIDVEKDVKGKTMGDLGSAKGLSTPFDQPTHAEGTTSAMWKPQCVEQRRHELAGKIKSQLHEGKMKLSAVESALKEFNASRMGSAQESSLLRQMLKDPPSALNMSGQPSPASVFEPLFSEDVNAAGRELDESQTCMPLEEHAKPEAALPDDPELMFDFTSEVFKELQEKHSCSPWVSLLEHNVRPGENLIQEVCNVVERHLQRPSQCTLDDMTRQDLRGRSWMEVQSDIEGIVMETGHAILEDLIEEAAFEMLI